MGNRRLDLAGQVFGRLQAVKVAAVSDRGAVLWEFQCACGNVVVRQGSLAVRGAIQSCGCLKRSVKPPPGVVGRVFNGYQVTAATSRRIRGQVVWQAVCTTCGAGVERTSTKLRVGSCCSCRREMKLPDPQLTATRNTWRSLLARCRNPRHTAFHNYGGRGITVCDRWLDFGAFKADVGLRPEGKELDRIDNERGYEPGNVRWVARIVNARNRRGLRIVHYEGQEIPVAALAELANLPYHTVWARIRRGWTPEQAVQGATR